MITPLQCWREMTCVEFKPEKLAKRRVFCIHSIFLWFGLYIVRSMGTGKSPSASRWIMANLGVILRCQYIRAMSSEHCSEMHLDSSHHTWDSAALFKNRHLRTSFLWLLFLSRVDRINGSTSKHCFECFLCWNHSDANFCSLWILLKYVEILS